MGNGLSNFSRDLLKHKADVAEEGSCRERLLGPSSPNPPHTTKTTEEERARGRSTRKTRYSTAIEPLMRVANRYPDELVIFFPRGPRVPYIDFLNKMQHIANALLSNGVMRRHIVAVTLNDDVQSMVLLLGIIQIGAAAMLLKPSYTSQAVCKYLVKYKPKFITGPLENAVLSKLNGQHTKYLPPSDLMAATSTRAFSINVPPAGESAAEGVNDTSNPAIFLIPRNFDSDAADYKVVTQRDLLLWWVCHLKPADDDPLAVHFQDYPNFQLLWSKTAMMARALDLHY